jgi:hypothetical protein
MNLRVPVLGVALLSIAATGNPCDVGSSTGTSSTTSPGANGAVCEVSVATPCCVAVNDPCSDNLDCCSGNCSGNGGGDSGFGEGGSSCAEPANQGCSVALSSRCNTGQCECTQDADCCLGNCLPSIIPGTKGLRCCLESGSPCGADADCCSLTCNNVGEGGASGQCE